MTNVGNEEHRTWASQAVERFVSRFDESYRLLAYHAALPLVLTPELVNYLRNEFLRGEQVPWVAEVDLLLSDLCSQVGYELYTMDTHVRAYLLEQMEQDSRWGRRRMQEVAQVLISYVNYLSRLNPGRRQQEIEAQRWAAMVYLGDEECKTAAKEIAQRLLETSSGNESNNSSQSGIRAELARITRITEELSRPLRKQESLLRYARLVQQILRNPEQVNSEELLVDYQVEGIELSFTDKFLSESLAKTVAASSKKATQFEGFPPIRIFPFKVATIEIKLEFNVVTLVPKEQVNNRPKAEDIYFREERLSGSPDHTRYESYKQLSENEQEGIDYCINLRQNSPDTVIIAHHGGYIQPGTTEIADAIAGEDYAFYSFAAIKESFEDTLYIPSYNFDEPQALDLVSKANRVIAIHGLFGNDEFVIFGGLNNNLKEQIKQSLQKAGFTKIGRESTFPGTDPDNICNRGTTGKGVQIGISWGLRKKLFDGLKSESNEPTLFDRFVQAIRDALSPLEAAGLRYQTTQGQADFYTEELAEGVELDMISIPGGSFTMGSPADETDSYDDERPQHQVTVPSFHMGRYPITQAQWQAVAELDPVSIELDPDPSHFKDDYERIDGWKRPVEQVSWEEATEFCHRLSQKTGKKYRLPTEAEWEYACRSVISHQSSVISKELTIEEWNQQYNQPFHFGQTISTELANYNGEYVYGEGVEGEYRGQTTPVGYFQVANNFGLSDMHGNVWEWCEDDWHVNYEDGESAPNDGSAWVSKESNNKVIRSSS